MFKKFILTVMVMSCILTAGAVVVNEPGPPVEDKDIKPQSYIPSKADIQKAEKKNTEAKQNSKTENNIVSETNNGTETIEPVKTQSASSSNSSGGPLDSIAMAMLKAAEARDNATMQKHFKKLMEAGVETYYQPQVIAKKTPKCPPIKMEINGKNLSGKLCAKTGYVYEGKTYWVGYCK